MTLEPTGFYKSELRTSEDRTDNYWLLHLKSSLSREVRVAKITLLIVLFMKNKRTLHMNYVPSTILSSLK